MTIIYCELCKQRDDNRGGYDGGNRGRGGRGGSRGRGGYGNRDGDGDRGGGYQSRDRNEGQNNSYGDGFQSSGNNGGGNKYGDGFGGASGGGNSQPQEFYSGHNPQLDDLYKEVTNTGLNFDKMDEIDIQLSDFKDVADDSALTLENTRKDTFDQMELEPELLQNIKKLGWTKPTPIQVNNIF